MSGSQEQDDRPSLGSEVCKRQAVETRGRKRMECGTKLCLECATEFGRREYPKTGRRQSPKSFRSQKFCSMRCLHMSTRRRLATEDILRPDGVFVASVVAAAHFMH